MSISNALRNELKRSSKVRVRSHVRRPSAVNAYMICNEYGAFVGGNLRCYMPYAGMGMNDYPAVFKSKSSAKRWMREHELRVKAAEEMSFNNALKVHGPQLKELH
jgi:hypothetical protein